MRFGKALTVVLALGLALSGCGITYIPSKVAERGTDVDVEIVPITPATISAANATPYAPRALPAAFYAVAGEGSPRGAGALPPPPVTPDLAPRGVALRPPPSAEQDGYRLGVGDVVRLAARPSSLSREAILGDPLESAAQIYTVRDDGSVGIPAVGPVMLSGLTIDEAESRLFDRFVEAGVDPTFSLEVQTFAAHRITVGGDVTASAIVPVGLELPTIDEVLTAAGGLAVQVPEYASIRIYRDGTLYQIPVENYLSSSRYRQLRLDGGDQVFVDSSYDLDRAFEYYRAQIEILGLRRGARAQALAELSTEIGLRRAALAERRSVFGERERLGANPRDHVYLAGEVTGQTRWPLPYEMRASLADALYDSGGLSAVTGNPAQIYVIRAGRYLRPDAQITAWHLDASNAVNLAYATAFELRPNDVIFVEEQPITRFNRAFAQFAPRVISLATGGN